MLFLTSKGKSNKQTNYSNEENLKSFALVSEIVSSTNNEID